jgi:hypothetical protein
MQEQIALIDKELRAMFPHAPFSRIKQELLTDQTAIIVTLKQYRGLLEYRLKNYRPKKANQMKSIRTEILPDWFEETPKNDGWGGMKPVLKEMLDNPPKKTPEELQALKREIDKKLKQLRD